MKNAFCEYIKEEIKIWDERKPPISFPAWHVSENFVEGPKGEYLLDMLYSRRALKRLYKTKERIGKIISRAFNAYINMLFEKKKEGYQRGLAVKIFNEWIEEVSSPRSSALILVPVIHLKINRKIKIGEIELFPVKQSGRFIELESQIHQLLEYPKKRRFVTMTSLTQSYLPFFRNASALRIKYVFNKPDTFFDYTSFPPPGYEKAREKIDNFVTLLRLFKEKDLRIENYFSSLSSLFVPSVISYSGGLRQYAGSKYLLTDEREIRRFRVFLKKLLPILQELDRLPGSVQIGIEYFNSSFQKTKTHERFIDLMISLDALLGVGGEARYRVSLRTACLLEKDKEKRIEMVGKVKEIMSLRGRLVHGNIHPTSKRAKIESSKLYLEGVVRKIIVKLLNLHLKTMLTDDYKDKVEFDYIL